MKAAKAQFSHNVFGRVFEAKGRYLLFRFGLGFSEITVFHFN